MKKDLVIYGAGGLGREVFCLARLLERWNILGFVDDGKTPGENISGLPVLNLTEIFEKRTEALDIVLGFADPHAKAKVYERLKQYSHISFPTLIAPTAYVEQDAALAEGCIIQHFCTISINTTLEKFVLVNAASHVGHDSSLGDFCTVMPSSNISGAVTIGNECLIGAQSFILQGKSIGNNVTVAAGSRVFTDVEPNVTVFGYPASVINRKKK